jgi:thiamine biosynthesis protein ThiC
MRRVVSAGSVALMLVGCASKSSDIAPSYVSPMQYDAYNCQQLAEEAQRVSAHAAEAAGAQDSQATKDAVVTTAAIVVFWPAAFFVGGDKQNAAELARLRGEMEAIEQTSIRKKCGIQFRQTAAASPVSTPH